MDIVKSIRAYYLKIRNCISPPPPPKPNEANLTFMTCLLKVDTNSPGWHKAIIAILRSNKGVRSFKMSQSGKIMVTGTGDLNLLLKMLKKTEKSTELVWVQSGLCSSNLFLINDNGHQQQQLGPRGPFGLQPWNQPAPLHSHYDFNGLFTTMSPPPLPPPPPPAYHGPPPLNTTFGVDHNRSYLQHGRRPFRPSNQGWF
ncbi:unnamed protein product [Cuscuta europaea]|uniref:Uncharacterized protein n=1 Tax=Cuscuta europaea TaxID=41803 RepID=A0A9P0YS62_CUSEU|nr:unnamed protein product [Cuscuta europaea]